MFDKPTGRVAFPNVRDVCQAKFYNDGFLRDQQGTLPDDVSPDTFERQFGTWEDAFNEVINAALRVADGKGASLEERQTMAICVAIQLARTPQFRQQISERIGELLIEDATIFLEKKNPGITKDLQLDLTLPPEWVGALHQQFLWQSGEIPEIATDLFYYIWRIGVNVADLPLCTSDHPVMGFVHDVLSNSSPSREMTGNGGILKNLLLGRTSMYGLEIIYPLSPRVALLMYHPDYFHAMHDVQGRRKALHRNDVLHYNALQLLNADRQVYSCENNFEIIRAHASTYAEADTHGRPDAEPQA
ncbi:hypothetical protein FHS01_000798 [Longimicrobium terrae]|nr:hypothetical protein [Longimicrobium terrae]